MQLLNPASSHKWLPIVEPLLHKAYDTTNVGIFVDKEVLRESLKDGTNHCFLSDECEYAGVFYVSENSIRCWMLGGKEPDTGWSEVSDFLDSMAKIFKKPYVQIEGRLGWKRKLRHLGYEVDSLILIKEVNE